MQDNIQDQLFKEEDELSMLKQRATRMGIEFSPNIGIEKLKARINDKMEGGNLESEIAPLTDPTQPVPKKTETLRQTLVRENMKLVRLSIVNLNPTKRDLPGEVFTVANEYVGAVKKYIPYGEAGKSYHVPYCIYKLLKRKKFLDVRVLNSGKKGVQINHNVWVPEFNLTILPPLSKMELADLAANQHTQGAD